MANPGFDFGMIGLGVMGRNLLLNMADHGIAVIGFDKDPQKGKALEESAAPGSRVRAVSTLRELLDQLSLPRRMILLVPAGKAVDDLLEELSPLLSPGDIVIDSGNSHYTDTQRRLAACAGKGFHFLGMGISGGEQGARTGPSLMPGGEPAAYAALRDVLEAIAARVGNSPCVAHLGLGAAGHYVKMVHNGIEYAIMQLISEAYDLLHRGMGMTHDELYRTFRQWNEGELQSYLVGITKDIFLMEDSLTGGRLLDQILDKAGSKGTGKWTSQDAMDLPVPVPVIDMAVSMRDLSACKDDRIKAAAIYKSTPVPIDIPREIFVQQLGDALLFGMIISYAQGLHMLSRASDLLKMEIPLPEVVRVWRGGCIIRAGLLETFSAAFRNDPGLTHILLDKQVAALIQGKKQHLRHIVMHATQTGYPVAAFMSALSYFDAFRSEQLPTNLIQAQRDYFGAHTYQRVDRPGTFHTEWESF